MNESMHTRRKTSVYIRKLALTMIYNSHTVVNLSISFILIGGYFSVGKSDHACIKLSQVNEVRFLTKSQPGTAL